MMPSPLAVLALFWLLLLGWGLYAVLRRCLNMDERLAGKEADVMVERQLRASAERALMQTQRSLHRLARQHEHVRESERQRIGRDIHDDLGQHLLALKIDLSLLHVSTTGAHPLIMQKVAAMLGGLDQAIVSLRAIIHDLRPLALEQGLRCALVWQLAEFSRIHGIDHLLDADGEVFEAAPDAQRDAMLFRILQESLANVVRHAHATEVKVELRLYGGEIRLRVEDNGVGMLLPGSGGGRGCGLPGMRERVISIGGRFHIDSLPGMGTVLSLSIPVAERAA